MQLTKDFPLPDIIRFTQPFCDINRTRPIIKRCTICSETHQTWSDKWQDQGADQGCPLTLCLLGQVPGPFRASICFKGDDTAILRELVSKLNVWKHPSCNKYWIRENRTSLAKGSFQLAKNRPAVQGFSSVQFSGSVVSDSLQLHGLQHARPSCPSPTPGAYSNSNPLSWWWYLTISSSVIPFSHLQSFPASESLQISQFFTSGGQSIRVLKFQFQYQSFQWIFRSDFP